MGKFIYIEGDSNDGDYIGKLSPITDEEIQMIMPMIQAINAWVGDFNYPNYDEHAEGDVYKMYGHITGFNKIGQFVPHGEHGIHTIVDIKILNLLEQL